MRPIHVLIIAFSLMPARFSSLAQDTPSWAGFRGDQTRSGRALAAGPESAEPGWTVRLDGSGYSSAAIAGDGMVFVGAGNNVHAISADGQRVWVSETDGMVVSSPAVTRHAVYVGSRDGYLYALHRSNGARMWRFRTNDEVWSSPAVGGDGTIYVGSFDGCLYAISPAGAQRWRRCTGGGIAASPTLAPDGRVFFGSRDGNLYAVRSDGTNLWQIQPVAGDEIISTAALAANGTLYVATRGGRLAAISGSGLLVWQQVYQIGAETIASPALAQDGTLLIGAVDGSLHAVQSDGRPRWSAPVQLGSEIISSAVVDTRGTLYVGSSDGQLHAIGADGASRWVHPLEAPVWASPSLGRDGTLIVATTGSDFDNGRLHALASLDFSVETPSVAAAGEDVPLHIQARESLSGLTGRLFYRSGGERVFSGNVPMTSVAPGVLEAAIPAEAVSIRGVEYYVELDGPNYRRTYPPFRPSTRPAVQRVEIASMAADVLLPRLGYRMVSVPLVLADASVAGVLGDVYGPYTQSQWRLFRWENDAYQEHPNIDASLSPGASFFLATASGVPFNVQAGLSTDTAEPYRIALRPGWNQIANPFAFPVSWQEVQGAATVGALAYWDGQEMRQDAASIGTLRPWEGYFAYNPHPAPVVIEIPALEAVGAGSSVSLRRDRRVWRIEARRPQGGPDTQNWIGFTPSLQSDRVHEAPSFDDHVRLSVVDSGERFATLLRPETGDGASWDVEVTVSGAGDLRGSLPVSIAIVPESDIPRGYSVGVVDVQRQAVLRVDDGSFVVELSRRHPVRHLEIIIGPSDYVQGRVQGLDELPAATNLLQNYPNPFNSETAILFQTTEIENVRLEVFDLTGRRIRALAAGVLGVGRHEIIWDGSDAAGRSVASGAYLYRLHTDSGTWSRMMILNR